jgi:hypothetical protein
MASFLEGEAECIRYFDERAPRGLDLALLRLVLTAYPKAKDICESITAREEDRDLRGHVRRALLDGSLPTLIGRFPVSVLPMPNATDTQVHREVRFEDVVITVSHLRKPRERLRDSRFRDTLARPPRPLFPEPDDIWSGSDLRLFAVLIHGSPSPFDVAPDFANIVFPTEGGWHGLGIDLLSRYPAQAPRPTTALEFGKPSPALRTDIELPTDEEAIDKTNEGTGEDE